MSDPEKPDSSLSVPVASATPPTPKPKPAALASAPTPELPRLDKESIDREVEAAMGGLSEQEIYGEMSAGGRKPVATAEEGRKKGRILQVRGNDVFVDVPGGRT